MSGVQKGVFRVSGSPLHFVHTIKARNLFRHINALLSDRTEIIPQKYYTANSCELEIQRNFKGGAKKYPLELDQYSLIKQSSTLIEQLLFIVF